MIADFELKARLLKEQGASFSKAKAMLLGSIPKKQVVKKAPGAWEKLTQGRCNWAGLEDVIGGRVSPAEFKRKEMNRKKVRKAQAKFDQAATLSGKELRKLSDAWDNRNSTNTAGFFDQKKAREAKRGAAC